ncbi:hypothetical protein F4781DRAFT_273664 [Annulohypoxylon bovei var. microspora]|nr:hypothetical protein F4781DRAFT_273664 [Annulohypoxylon bovei var. microspora]
MACRNKAYCRLCITYCHILPCHYTICPSVCPFFILLGTLLSKYVNKSFSIKVLCTGCYIVLYCTIEYKAVVFRNYIPRFMIWPGT